jgi:hypothetical protein
MQETKVHDGLLFIGEHRQDVSPREWRNRLVFAPTVKRAALNPVQLQKPGQRVAGARSLPLKVSRDEFLRFHRHVLSL